MNTSVDLAATVCRMKRVMGSELPLDDFHRDFTPASPGK